MKPSAQNIVSQAFRSFMSSPLDRIERSVCKGPYYRTWEQTAFSSGGPEQFDTRLRTLGRQVSSVREAVMEHIRSPM